MPGVHNCKRTYRSTDDNTCKDFGMDIVVPRSKNHWEKLLARYHSSYFSVIPGISKPTSGGSYTNKAMNSRTPNIDYRAIDGGTWWLRDNAYIQPSGDYTANCWLGAANVQNVDSITFNDGNCYYSTDEYVCSTKNTFAVQNDDPKRWAVEKIQIYAKTNTWILEKQRLDKIYGYKYHLESKMFHAVELHKAKARYVRIKVPSYCSNTDVITNIHVTVNELNTKKCTIAVDSVKRFCPDDESINLGQKGTILKTKFGIDVQ